MAVSEAYANSATISTTEFSCPQNANYSSGSPVTVAGCYQVFLDVNALATGDEFQIKIYEKVRSASTQRVTYQSNIIGPQSPAQWVSPALMLLNGWDVTLLKIAGTDRAIEWSIRKA